MISRYETAVNDILPAVRVALAKELNEQYHLKEGLIAHYLGVAQAAVSKYLNGKYSDRIKEIEAKIDKAWISDYVKKIVEGKREYANVCYCTVCNLLNKFDCPYSATEKSMLTEQV